MLSGGAGTTQKHSDKLPARFVPLHWIVQSNLSKLEKKARHSILHPDKHNSSPISIPVATAAIR